MTSLYTAWQVPDGHLSRLNDIEDRCDVLGRGTAAREWDLREKDILIQENLLRFADTLQM